MFGTDMENGMIESSLLIRPIARIRNDMKEKFGIPRQSGLVPELISRIAFEPLYADRAAVRGLDGFSHIWLIWGFSEVIREKNDRTWSPTVRPPRLGGNERMGVFATRSPFRPNALGLSCVELKGILYDQEESRVVLQVAGADLMDGTPIYDIKPYVPYTDARPQAVGGFTQALPRHVLRVDFPDALRLLLTEEQADALTGILAQDPRPAYQDDPDRVYGLRFAGFNVRFRVENDLLTVTGIKG